MLPIALGARRAVAEPGFAQEPGNPAVYAPGEMARAEFTLDQRTDEGGRLTPFYTHYRPNFAFGGGKPMKCECRSEEHTSDLQSLMRTSYAVFSLKKKKNPGDRNITRMQSNH